MKPLNKTSTLLAILVTVLMTFTGSAQAEEIDFADFFRWGGASGQLTYSTTINGVGVTVTAGPTVTGVTLQQSLFGMGVDWQDGLFDLDEGVPISQEIDSLESLIIAFDRPVVLVEARVSSFYRIGFPPFILQQENAGFFYRDPNNISQGFRFNANGNLLGAQTITINSAPTREVTFVANTVWNGWRDTAYALQGLTFLPQ